MTSRQHEESLFEAARQLGNKAARRAFLDQACSGQPELLQRLESLLSAEADADKFFTVTVMPPGELAKRLADGKLEPTPAPEADDRSGLAEGLGTRIGNYKLLQKIGEGGCGVVYMAEQTEPVRRQVALKVIKLGSRMVV